MRNEKIGTGQGVALYVGAILGTGVLVLPALAAERAGPASLVAWTLLLIVSVPVAFVFGRLARDHPDGGGVATFVGRAFGPRWSGVVGWWFYFALPVGLPAGALIGGQYVAAALHAGTGVAVSCAIAILVAVFVSNYFGLKIAGWLQMTLMVLLVAILVAAIVLSVPRVNPANLRPFAPGGARGVFAATGLLLYSFVGWEAMTHLSAQFRDPRRQTGRVTLFTLTVVGALYLGFVLACVLVIGPGLGADAAPLTTLLEGAIGGAARPFVAAAAILLTFGSLNAYVAGAAQLGGALARDGALPGWLGADFREGRMPRRSLGLLAAITVPSFAVSMATGISLATIITFPSSCYVAVTVAGLLSSTRLLPPGPVPVAALVASLLLTVILIFTGWPLLLPLLIGGSSLAYATTRKRRLASKAG